MSEKEKPRYPLSWPDGWKRTRNRIRAQFGRVESSADGRYSGKKKITVEDGFDRIENELKLFGVETSTVIVSTNLKLNMRGVPTGNAGEPSDPGVAVYWKRKGKPESMAIDTYTRVADNLAAIAKTLFAMRAIERHGGAEILERTFIGFAQITEKSGGRPWREVFGTATAGSTPINLDTIEERYRYLAGQLHPDKGGGDLPERRRVGSDSRAVHRRREGPHQRGDRRRDDLSARRHARSGEARRGAHR